MLVVCFRTVSELTDIPVTQYYVFPWLFVYGKATNSLSIAHVHLCWLWFHELSNLWASSFRPKANMYSSQGEHVFVPRRTCIRPKANMYSSQGEHVFVPRRTCIRPKANMYSSQGEHVIANLHVNSVLKYLDPPLIWHQLWINLIFPRKISIIMSYLNMSKLTKIQNMKL